MLVKKKIFDISGIVIYRILLDFCYVNFINPIFLSTGYANEATLQSYIASWIILLILLPFIISNYNKKTLSANIVTLFACMSFIPMTSLIAFVSVTNEFVILTFLYWLMLFLVNKYLPLIKLPKKQGKTNYVFTFWLIVLCSTVVYISGKYTNFRFHLGLFDVYELRFEEREFGMPILLTYLKSAANILLPIMLVYYLSCKRYVIVVLLGIIILLNFGIGGHKSVLFMLFLCFLGYWFYNYRRMALFCWGMAFVCLVSVGEAYIFDSYFSITLLVNRVLYTPAQLNIYYYDFFSTHEFDYFRQGILRWFGAESPYSNISFLIGDIYYDMDETRANNGLFSDAYANLGALGAFVLPFILIVILRLLDACAKGLNEKLIILPILTTGLSLISTSFSTVLLTNGLLLTMLILYYLPKDNGLIKNNSSENE